MARIIVTPDEQRDVVLLDENVYPVHLDNELSSLQVIEFRRYRAVRLLS